MKLRRVMEFSLLGMLASCVGVYTLTAPGDLVKTARAAEVGALELSQAHVALDGTLRLEARLAHPELPLGDRDSTFMLVEARAADVAPRARAPVSVTLVLDRSGSMAGDRMQHARDAARGVIARLGDDDEVALIAFDAQAEVLVPLTRLDAVGRARVAQALEGVLAAGETCLSCGIEQAMAQGGQAGLRQVMVLSDGKANGGVRDAAGFRRIADAARDAGVAITTVGVGLDYSEEILATLAEGSNGRHHFVANESALSSLFDAETQMLASTVATRARLSITLAPGVELVEVHDRVSTRGADARQLSVELGAFSRSEVKTVLVELRAAGTELGTMPVARVDFRYDDQVSQAEQDQRAALSLAVRSATSLRPEMDPFVAARVERGRTSAALERANALFRGGRVDAARAALDEQNRRVAASAAKIRASARSRGLSTGSLDEDLARQSDATASAKTGFSPKPKPKSFNIACGCASNDLMCHMRCSGKKGQQEASEFKR